MICRQLELDLGAVLRPPQDERLHHRPQSLERPRVAVRLDRAREAALEPLARAEQAGVDDVHDRPELVEPVLDRRARHRERAARVEPAQRARPLGGGVLDVLRLVEQQPVPADQRRASSMSRVAMSYEVITTSLERATSHELGAGEPLAAVVEVDAQRRREPLDLPRPLPGDAHRADDERGAERLDAELLPLRGEHRDRLDRLAEPHVVGEDRADPEVAEQPQPAVAALLEREERLGHRSRRAERLVVPFVAAVEQRGERVVEDDVAELEPRVLELDARDGAHEVDDRPLAAALEEQQRLLDLGAPQGVPAPAHADQRLLRCRELDRAPPRSASCRRSRASSRTGRARRS